jgi:hypothetical protein
VVHNFTDDLDFAPEVEIHFTPFQVPLVGTKTP